MIMVKDDILKIQKKEDLRQSLSSIRASLKDMENVKAAKELLGDARAVAELLKEEEKCGGTSGGFGGRQSGGGPLPGIC